MRCSTPHGARCDPAGALVANAVTLEGEAALCRRHRAHGGEICASIPPMSFRSEQTRTAPAHGRAAMAVPKTMNRAGKLYGVGVGPGDIELLTLKAARLLSEVKIIAYPAANGGESLARRIVAPLLPENAREVPISIPMEETFDAARSAYDAAAQSIADHLRQGRDVLFLCEGDPFPYGSFMFRYERLGSSFETIIVPGVTSLDRPRQRARTPARGAQ